jgi:CHASE1-domain containing sensor protein
VKAVTLKGLLHHPATAWVILLLSLVLTGAAWYLSDNFVQQRARDRFNFQMQDVKASIQRRMLEYEAVLRGGIGLFKASERVSRQAWRIYAENLQVDRYFPGIQGLGYSQVVLPQGLQRHEQQLREEGFPDYRVKPPGERPLYTAIVFLEPFDFRNQRAFGYDMFSESTRREAMQRARDTGVAALSGRVTLVQETDDDVQSGVLIYLPLYESGRSPANLAQRQATLRGFVYAPFRMGDLMQGILGADQGGIEFELYDGALPSLDSLLYQSGVGPLRAIDRRQPEDYDGLDQMEIAGRVWTLYIRAHQGFLSRAEESQPLLVAVGGVLVDVLLFVIIGSIARQQRRAEAMAMAMTTDLRRSNADLEQFAYASSHDMRQPLRMVSSYLQLLEEALRPQLQRDTAEYLKYAIDGAQRMDQMLDALLEYSRVGSGNPPRQHCSSRGLLDEALRYLQPEIDGAGAVVRIHGKWPDIWVVPDEMVRLFQNLIGNAVKFRVADRVPQIDIEVQPTADNRNLQFSVTDNGIGLQVDQQTRLFKVFERLHSRERYTGTGIGLALSRKIIERHAGCIWVESAGENAGCRFVFELPVKR